MSDVGSTAPPIWIGHVHLTVSDPEAAHDLYAGLGMRSIHVGDRVAILELAGGTHLVLMAGQPSGGEAPFDLMVDDLPGTRAAWAAGGLDVSDIVAGDIHDRFVLTDADGYEVEVFNSHVMGVV